MKSIKMWWQGAGVAALSVATALVLPPTASLAASPADGLSSETAAASCYEIKQNNPSSKSGAYWLYTPAMDAPAQFYCDQETDGGGWVLIGRGREGWTQQDDGKGNASELATNPDGTDAFTPVQLPSSTVDALYNGAAPSSSSQGVRIRRALTKDGSRWQEFRATRNQVQNWSWAFSAKANWSNIKFDNPSIWYGFDRNVSSAQGNIVGVNLNYNYLKFEARDEQNAQYGFGYGSLISGTEESSSYIYSYQRHGYALPFSQVFVRPQLTQANLSWQTISDSGVAEQTQRALPKSTSATMKWRTSEQTGTGTVDEMNTFVQAITEVNGTVFVGGDYKYVQSSSGEQVQQSYLTGYNVKTGDLVRTFMPKFNGQIKALEALPNGTLAVGGEFTQVNGQASNGFVVLNPVTGEIDTTYSWDVVNRGASAVSAVKSIHYSNGYLYIGGRFTHVKGNSSETYAYSRNAARFNISKKGAVDWNWTPVFNGTVNGINAAEDGSAVYAAGYFTTLSGESAYKLAAISPDSGKRLRSWDWDLSYEVPGSTQPGFQFDVQDVGSSVFAGGAEHLIAQYSKSDFRRLSSAMTLEGGDFQDTHYAGGVLYGACHCGDWIYEGSSKWYEVYSQYSNVYQMKLVAAFDPATGKVLADFSPIMYTWKGYGIWESFRDSTGVLWVGGDITATLGAKGKQKTVGFARYEPRDAVAPAAPSNLQVAQSGSVDKLSWSASSEKGVIYQVLRNDRVIATVSSTSYEVAHTDGARYFVRASDAAGNTSASTQAARVGAAAVVADNPQVQDPATPNNQNQLIPAGSTWQYKLGTEALGDNWNTLGAAVTGWSEGTAPIGWGNGNPTTSLEAGKALSLYLRKEVQLDSKDGASLVLTTRADDGLVLYVNGHEVNRTNMPSGALTYKSYATLSPNAKTAAENPVVVTVPAEYLVEGTNLISAEVHAGYRATPSVTFELTAELVK